MFYVALEVWEHTAGPALRRSLLVAGLMLSASATAHSNEDADFEARKQLYAAAVVLASASSTINGTVHVVSRDKATFAANFSVGPIVFRRIAPCKFGEFIYPPGSTESDHYQQFTIVDFDKLTGRWVENGAELDFVSSGTAHCWYHADNDQGCWRGRLYIPQSSEHGRLIDDAMYVLRHGCNAGTDADPQ